MTARRIRPAYQPRIYPVPRFAVGDRVRAVGIGLPAGVGWITLAWWPLDDPAPGWWYAVEWRDGGRGMAGEDELVKEGGDKMLERQCDHCDKSVALYWVSFIQTPAVSFAHAGGHYPPGSGVLVWARTVDDAQAAVLGRAVGLSHPVTVCPLSELPGLLQAGREGEPL